MRRIAVLAVVAASFGSSPLAAQSRWAKAFGTPFWDEGMALALKADGTILVTAETDTRSASTGDACYMALSPTGQKGKHSGCGEDRLLCAVSTVALA